MCTYCHCSYAKNGWLTCANVVQILAAGEIGGGLMCMHSCSDEHGEIILRDPRCSGVHYGGGKHAVLLKKPETFAKVSK